MANGTPESEFSIECFQNYSAPEVFIQGLAGMVNQTDVETMIRAQKQMLQRFEKTNEMLTNCNALSASRLKVAGAEFKKHTQLLIDMKKDLDYIFKKIRTLKTKLSTQYPEAFEIAQKAALAKASQEDDEDEFEEATGKQPKTPTTLSKDISKSTETLRPSISQVFSKSPNEPDDKTVKEKLEVCEDKKTNENDEHTAVGNEENKSIVLEESNQNSTKIRKQGAKGKDISRKISKDDRASSASSSSDNSNCSETSGDCTSDTG